MVAYGLLNKAGLVNFGSLHEVVYGFEAIHGRKDRVYGVNVVEGEKRRLRVS